MEESGQRSLEWFKSRLGKMTASEIYVLLKDHKEAMTDEELKAYKEFYPKSRVTTKTVPFSDVTFTYLNTKTMENYLPLNSDDVAAKNAVEEYINDRSFSNRAVEWGTLMENAARKRYEEETGTEVFEVGFIPYGKFPKLTGGSPDGMVRQDKGIIEIKCPWTLEKHMQHLLYETQDELKDEEPQYYWQCVMNMLVTNTEYCDFISYNPYVSRSKQLKVLRVARRDDDTSLLESRIALAVDYIKETMKKLDRITIKQ